MDSYARRMTWLSGGVLFAVGAALWVAYLLPSMLRRRHAQAAEHEAAQLQQALQSLAETGELPAEIPSPRDQLRERKMRDKHERVIERENLKALHDAEAQRKALAKQQRSEARHTAEARRASLIRLRTTAAWVLLLSLVTIVGGTVAVFFGVTWMVIGAGVIGAVAALVTLRGIVTRLATLSAHGVGRRAAADAEAFTPVDLPTSAPSRRWTPQPLPSPLHLAEGSAAAATIASSDAVEALRRRAREVAAESAQPAIPSVAAARARAAAMAAHPATYGKQLRAASSASQAAARTVSASAAPNPRMSAAEQVAARYASLDALPGVDEAAFDVSEVLQRRRAV